MYIHEHPHTCTHTYPAHFHIYVHAHTHRDYAEEEVHVAAQACNPMPGIILGCTESLRLEVYIRPCLKNNNKKMYRKLGIWQKPANTSALETEAKGSMRGQLELPRETLSKNGCRKLDRMSQTLSSCVTDAHRLSQAHPEWDRASLGIDFTLLFPLQNSQGDGTPAKTPSRPR